MKVADKTYEDFMTDGYTARSCPQCGCVDAPTKCGDMYNGDPTSGCFTLNDDDECVITNPACQLLTCSETRMTGFFRADVIGLTSAPATSGLVNDAACTGVSYNGADNTIQFDIQLGDCGMDAESIDGLIRFTSVISYGGTAQGPTAEGIYLASSIGSSSMEMSCSYEQEALTNDLVYQVTSTTENWKVDQITNWAALELKFFVDETFAAEIEDNSLAIGAPVHMQVLWDQTFSSNFPVQYYISECIVSDDEGHQFNVINAGCGATVLDTTLLSTAYSQTVIQYKYNSFSFVEEQTVNHQTVTCHIGFCLQADIDSGACGFDPTSC